MNHFIPPSLTRLWDEPLHLHAFQNNFSLYSYIQHCLTQIGPLKITVRQIGSRQVGVLQNSIFKVNVPQVQLGKVSIGKIHTLWIEKGIFFNNTIQYEHVRSCIQICTLKNYILFIYQVRGAPTLLKSSVQSLELHLWAELAITWHIFRTMLFQ
jgi:hypothetical protein